MLFFHLIFLNLYIISHHFFKLSISDKLIVITVTRKNGEVSKADFIYFLNHETANGTGTKNLLRPLCQHENLQQDFSFADLMLIRLLILIWLVLTIIITLYYIQVGNSIRCWKKVKWFIPARVKNKRQNNNLSKFTWRAVKQGAIHLSALHWRIWNTVRNSKLIQDWCYQVRVLEMIQRRFYPACYLCLSVLHVSKVPGFQKIMTQWPEVQANTETVHRGPVSNTILWQTKVALFYLFY